MKSLSCQIILLVTIIILSSQTLKAQGNLYFPPTTLNATWDTLSPSSLGWCTNFADTLENFLDTSDTKGFIILKDGKIAYERYFGSFTKDSIWYWASAGKTVTSLLIGIAQEEGFLSIDDSSSKFLGKGFTNCTSTQEGKITVKSQLTMTSGIDDNVTDLDCTDPSCLNYLVDPGNRWAYHNAMYLLLQDVIENATGQSLQSYTSSKINTPIGMLSFWFDGVLYSRTRDMARYGLMILNNGIWNNDTIIHDTNYFQEMVNPSQTINESYGYLWWLNGYNSYMLPQSQFVFPGEIIPNAPADLICGLGKYDQKMYIIPSQNLVVVRLGNDSGIPLFALSNYDNELWGIISQFICTPTSVINENSQKTFKIYPNPTNNILKINNSTSTVFTFTSMYGTTTKINSNNNELDLSNFSNGMYILSDGNYFEKVIIARP